MPIRWLAAALLFLLGFGSALLVNPQAKDAAPKTGTIDGKLKYVDSGSDLQLIQPADSETSYLIIVPLAPEARNAPHPQVVFQAGKASFRKADLQGMGIYQVVPIAKIRLGLKPDSIKCRPWEFCPIPPEPDPLPPGPRPRPLPQIDPRDFNLQFLIGRQGTPGRPGA